MKKFLFRILLPILIVLLLGFIGFKVHNLIRANNYREAVKKLAYKDTFYLSEATDFDWDRAVAFEFPVGKKMLGKVAKTKINFSIDLRSGIIFVKDGKVILKVFNSVNPEKLRPIDYELNYYSYQVYEKSTPLYAEIEDIDGENYYYIREKK